MRPQILKQVLTVSVTMASRDSLHHVDTAPRPRRFQLVRLGVCDRRRRVDDVLAPHQPLHLLVEHAIQRLEERSQPTWHEDDDGVRPPLVVGNKIFVSMALEVVQYQDS